MPDVIKALKRSSCIIWCALNPKTRVFTKRGDTGWREKHTEKALWSRRQSGVASDANSHKELEEARKAMPHHHPRPPEGAQPAHTVISGFRPQN